MSQALIEVDSLRKSYPGKVALDGIDLRIEVGEMVALLGSSGSGKSTLLRCLNGLIPADASSGDVNMFGLPVQCRGRATRHVPEVRRNTGFVFQQFQLVKRLSVITNVLCGMLGRMPLWRSLPGWFTKKEQNRAMEALERVGLKDYAWRRASQLSGGQQQRVAIARALAQGAKVILADEPVASLDPVSSGHVMQTLRDLNQSDGVTVVVSLHQVDMAVNYCPRIVALREGRVVYDGASSKLDPALMREIYQANQESGEDELH